jgi:hypothetical protein
MKINKKEEKIFREML